MYKYILSLRHVLVSNLSHLALKNYNHIKSSIMIRCYYVVLTRYFHSIIATLLNDEWNWEKMIALTVMCNNVTSSSTVYRFIIIITITIDVTIFIIIITYVVCCTCYNNGRTNRSGPVSRLP